MARKITGYEWIAHEPNMDLCLMMYIYQEKGLLSSYVINSSKNYGRDLAENPYSHRDGARWYKDTFVNS